jgi:hypothetical protein
LAFAETPVKSYSDTRKRTSNNYVKFTPTHKTVLRILDERAKMVYKHWIGVANGGRGMGAVCPGLNTCPLDALAKASDDEAEKQNLRARKRYIVNVLDRTPHTVCSNCSTKTPGKKCSNCDNDLTKKHEFYPLNQVKILEGGPQLFEQSLNAIEDLQQEELQKGITEYDIVFSTKGVGRDRVIVANPGAVVELTDDDFLDPETGEKQEVFDLKNLAEASTPDEIRIMLEGGGVAEINAAKGIE